MTIREGSPIVSLTRARDNGKHYSLCIKNTYAAGTDVYPCNTCSKSLSWGWGSQTPEKTTHPQVIISVQFSDLAGPQPGEVGTMEVLA